MSAISFFTPVILGQAPEGEAGQLPINATDILHHMRSFLGHREEARLALVSRVNREAGGKTQQWYRECMAPLRAEIEALSPGPLPVERFQQFLVRLFASPAVGHPLYWIPVMSALMEHVMFRGVHGEDELADVMVSRLGTEMAALLTATPELVASPNSIYQFCNCLGFTLRQLRAPPWMGYRVFEQYLLSPELDAASVNRALREYLTIETQKGVEIIDTREAGSFGISWRFERLYTKITVRIDPPNHWFGVHSSSSKYPFWESTGRRVERCEIMRLAIPEVMSEVLCAQMQLLRGSPENWMYVYLSTNVVVLDRDCVRLPDNLFSGLLWRRNLPAEEL